MFYSSPLALLRTNAFSFLCRSVKKILKVGRDLARQKQITLYLSSAFLSHHLDTLVAVVGCARGVAGDRIC